MTKVEEALDAVAGRITQLALEADLEAVEKLAVAASSLAYGPQGGRMRYRYLSRVRTFTRTRNKSKTQYDYKQPPRAGMGFGSGGPR